MKRLLLLPIMCALSLRAQTAQPAQAAAPATEKPVCSNEDFSNKFLQVLNWIDQDFRDDVATQKQLDGHEVRIFALEQRNDATAQLRAQLEEYKMQEQKRLLMAAALGSAAGAGIVLVVQHLK